jgi:hypothetical protein
MRSWFARRILRSTAKRYHYDTSYLEMMLEQSPRAFFKFASLAKASSHREVVPIEASFAAKIVGAMAEDCGPCTQLVVLRRDPHAMNEATILGFRFADAVVHRSQDEDEYRDAVRSKWSPKGIIDLTMALQMSRMFPMLKAGLGYAKECRRVTVDGHTIDVTRQAA